MFHLRVLATFSMFLFSSAEPSCSKYHYEEQILERVIKSEFLMRDFQKQFASLVDKVTSDLTSFKEDVGALRSDWKAFNEQTSQSVSIAIEDMQTRQVVIETKVTSMLQTLKSTEQNFVQQIDAFQDTMRTPHVSFRARVPADMILSAGSTIIYMTAEENLGNGYDTKTGVFTAPFSGVYSFSVNICLKSKDDIYVSIVKDNTYIMGTIVGDKYFYSCGTLSGYVVMEKKDKVWVICTDSGILAESYKYYWNAFSGFLVHQ